MKIISLTKGYFTVVDDIDYDWLSRFNWFANVDGSGHVTARASHNGKLLHMHRLIMAVYDSKVCIDHIDRNPLNNQRYNLRICTKDQNNRNSGPHKKNKSGYKGVNFYKNGKCWVAKISINNSKKHIGYFDNAREAALAYNNMARIHYGEFAYLNEVN